MYEKSPQIVHKLFTSNKKPHFLSRKWVFGGLGRNRTCILGSGNPHTIRCTTRPWALENQSRPWGRLWGCSGGRTRTSDLRVMSPTSYQLLYPAIIGRQRYDLFLCSPNYGRYLWPMMRLGVSWASWTTSYEPNRSNSTRSERLAGGI